MIILQITQDRIKLLEIARKGQRPKLKNISKKAIGGLSDAEISDAVSDLLNESGVRSKRPLAICVPRHLFTVRNLRLPSVDDIELREMASLQAGKQLPYPATELIWDFEIMEKRPDGYSDISLILGHRNVVDRFISILKNAKLEADRTVLTSEALLGWHIACGFNAEEEPKDRVKAVVDIDISHVDIIIARGGILEYSRCFPVKPQPQETADEIMKTFHSYEKDSSRIISSVALTGIEERAQAIKMLFEASESAKPAEFIHPLKVVALDYRETLTDYFDRSRDVSFACLLGIAYNLQAIKMDFLPPELKTERAGRQKRRLYAKTGLLAVAALLVICGIFIKGVIDRKSALDLLDSKIKETEPKVKKLRALSQNIEIIKRSLDTKGSSVDVMREVFKTAPQEVSISVLDFELEKSLMLRGVSTNLSGVFKFASDLKKSAYFEKCEIKYAQKRTIKEKEFIDFEIGCRLARVLK